MRVGRYRAAGEEMMDERRLGLVHVSQEELATCLGFPNDGHHRIEAIVPDVTRRDMGFRLRVSGPTCKPCAPGAEIEWFDLGSLD